MTPREAAEFARQALECHQPDKALAFAAIGLLEAEILRLELIGRHVALRWERPVGSMWEAALDDLTAMWLRDYDATTDAADSRTQ